MKNKLALFLPLGLMLSVDSVLTLNTYYSYDLISNNQVIRTASAVFAGLKALFFLPGVIFQLLGVVIDMVRDSIWLQSQSLRGGQFVDAVIEIPFVLAIHHVWIGHRLCLLSGIWICQPRVPLPGWRGSDLRVCSGPPLRHPLIPDQKGG